VYACSSVRSWGGGLTPTNPLLNTPLQSMHPSTVSVPVTVLLYDGPLLCGFNVAIKGLLAIYKGLRTRRMKCKRGLIRSGGDILLFVGSFVRSYVRLSVASNAHTKALFSQKD